MHQSNMADIDSLIVKLHGMQLQHLSACVNIRGCIHVCATCPPVYI